MSAAPSLPLHGVRVIDLTMVWAGPYATRMLADAGADVVKVEGISHPDPIRVLGAAMMGDIERPWDRIAYYNEYNRGKRDLVLELRRPEGRAALLELVRTADALIENYRAGMLEEWGLGPAVLQAERPDLIIVSMPGFSTRGSERVQAGYGPSIEMLGGLVQLTGYEDGPPQKSGISYGDPVAGTLASAALIAALLRRQSTGKGAVIEVSQRDNMIGLVGEAVLDWSMNHRLWPRRGNRHRWMAPHGCYPCLPLPEEEGRPLGRASMQMGVAVDRWVTLSVETDAQWQSLCRVIGRPELTADPHYAAALDRYERQDELDAIVAAWTVERSDGEAEEALQAAGIPASRVQTPLTLTQDAHLAERGFFRELEHPVVGPYRVAGPLWNSTDAPTPIRSAAPCFGQHNAELLAGLLGMSEVRIAQLHEAGITADRPG